MNSALFQGMSSIIEDAQKRSLGDRWAATLAKRPHLGAVADALQYGDDTDSAAIIFNAAANGQSPQDAIDQHDTPIGQEAAQKIASIMPQPGPAPQDHGLTTADRSLVNPNVGSMPGDTETHAERRSRLIAEQFGLKSAIIALESAGGNAIAQRARLAQVEQALNEYLSGDQAAIALGSQPSLQMFPGQPPTIQGGSQSGQFGPGATPPQIGQGGFQPPMFGPSGQPPTLQQYQSQSQQQAMQGKFPAPSIQQGGEASQPGAQGPNPGYSAQGPSLSPAQLAVMGQMQSTNELMNFLSTLGVADLKGIYDEYARIASGAPIQPQQAGLKAPNIYQSALGLIAASVGGNPQQTYQAIMAPLQYAIQRQQQEQAQFNQQFAGQQQQIGSQLTGLKQQAQDLIDQNKFNAGQLTELQRAQLGAAGDVLASETSRQNAELAAQTRYDTTQMNIQGRYDQATLRATVDYGIQQMKGDQAIQQIIQKYPAAASEYLMNLLVKMGMPAGDAYKIAFAPEMKDYVNNQLTQARTEYIQTQTQYYPQVIQSQIAQRQAMMQRYKDMTAIGWANLDLNQQKLARAEAQQAFDATKSLISSLQKQYEIEIGQLRTLQSERAAIIKAASDLAKTADTTSIDSQIDRQRGVVNQIASDIAIYSQEAMDMGQAAGGDSQDGNPTSLAGRAANAVSSFRVADDRNLINPNLLDILDEASNKFGVILVNTAMRGHSERTTTGNRSRHADGNAVDITSIGGHPVTSAEGKRLADEFVAWLESQGYTRNSESGHDKAVFWQTNVGGNHYNHIHVSNRTR